MYAGIENKLVGKRRNPAWQAISNFLQWRLCIKCNITRRLTDLLLGILKMQDPPTLRKGKKGTSEGKGKGEGVSSSYPPGQQQA